MSERLERQGGDEGKAPPSVVETDVDKGERAAAEPHQRKASGGSSREPSPLSQGLAIPSGESRISLQCQLHELKNQVKTLQ